MKVQEFEIQLEAQIPGQNYVLQAGNNVVGIVHLQLLKQIEIQSLRIRLQGKGKTSFSITGDHHTYAEEQYIDFTLFLIGGISEDTVTLDEGEHRTPFVIDGGILRNLPSSFDGKYGYVQYTMKAYIERSWKVDKCKSTVYIINPLDLNQIEDAVVPIDSEETKEVMSCCCVQSGTVVINVRLPKSGFIPEERVPIDIYIHNQCTRAIKELEIEIRQKTTFKGSGNEETDSKQRYPVYLDVLLTIERGEERQISPYITIPSDLPPSHLQHCNIIDTEYHLVVMVRDDSWSQISSKNRIFIGTIPLREFQHTRTTTVGITPSKDEPVGIPILQNPTTENLFTGSTLQWGILCLVGVLRPFNNLSVLETITEFQ